MRTRKGTRDAKSKQNFAYTKKLRSIVKRNRLLMLDSDSVLMDQMRQVEIQVDQVKRSETGRVGN